MNLPLIPHDKANHFVYGAVIAAAGSLVSPEVGLGVCILFGVGKEIYDWRSKKGTPDVWDALITILGGVLVLGF